MLKQSTLKIADWEYLYAEQIFDVYITHLLDATKEFAEIMDSVREEAISDDEGGIATQCELYGASMKEVKASLEAFQSSTQGKAEQFVEAIDKADQFIYGG